MRAEGVSVRLGAVAIVEGVVVCVQASKVSEK